MLVEALISVDAHAFLPLRPDQLSGCTFLPDSKETKLGSSNQEASSSAGKINGVVLMPCSAGKCVPTAISGGVDISEVPGCHLLWQMSAG